MLNRKDHWVLFIPLICTVTFCLLFFGFISFLTMSDTPKDQESEVKEAIQPICEKCRKPRRLVRIPIFDQEKQAYIQINEMSLCNNCKSLILLNSKQID